MSNGSEPSLYSAVGVALYGLTNVSHDLYSAVVSGVAHRNDGRVARTKCLRRHVSGDDDVDDVDDDVDDIDELIKLGAQKILGICCTSLPRDDSSVLIGRAF